MDKLGKDLIKDGVGSIIGEIAGSSSGGVGNFFDRIDKIYEANSNAEETVSHIKFALHLAHRERGVDYDSDCKVCNS